MFKPDGTDSIWVPLSLTSWSWQGSAAQEVDTPGGYSCAPTANKWNLTSSSAPPALSSNTVQYPVWTNTVMPLKYMP